MKIRGYLFLLCIFLKLLVHVASRVSLRPGFFPDCSCPIPLLNPPHFPTSWPQSAFDSVFGLVHSLLFFFFLPTLICKWSHSFSPYLPTISFILMASNAIYMLIIPKHITLNSSMVSRLTYLVADCIPTGISGLMCPQLSSHYGFHLSNCFFHCLLHLS